MRYPSIKTLSAIFDDPETARGVLDGTLDPCKVSSAASDIVREARNPVPGYMLKLWALNDIGKYYGVESFRYSDDYVEYLNAGDTYVPTLFYRPDLRDRWQVSTLGDVVETLERKGYAVS